MWNGNGRFIEADWSPYISVQSDLERRWNRNPREARGYDCSTLVLDESTYIAKREKEDSEPMSVQMELKKVAEITKNEIAKAWTRQYVNSFCSVKSIEVSVDHRTIVVVWADGDKTMVKRSAKDPDDLYMAFTAALAKKVYGSNSAIKRLINKKGNEHKPKEKKEVTE